MMAWWQIFYGILIQVGVAGFFAVYTLQRSELPNDGQEHSTFTKTHHKTGCIRVLNLPFAPGIFATVYFVYLLTIMFLFTPLHPTPNDTFWHFIFSGLMLTIAISFPVVVLAVVETVVVTRSKQVNVVTYCLWMLMRALFVLIGGEIAVWFVIYA